MARSEEAMTTKAADSSSLHTCPTCKSTLVPGGSSSLKRNLVARAVSRLSASVRSSISRRSTSPETSPSRTTPSTTSTSPVTPSKASSPGESPKTSTPETSSTTPSPGPGIPQETPSPATPSKAHFTTIVPKASAPATPSKTPAPTYATTAQDQATEQGTDKSPAGPTSTHTPADTPPHQHRDRPHSSHSRLSAGARSNATDTYQIGINEIKRMIRNDHGPRTILKAIESLPDQSDAVLLDILDETHAILIASRNDHATQWDRFQERATLFSDSLAADAALTDKDHREIVRLIEVIDAAINGVSSNFVPVKVARRACELLLGKLEEVKGKG